MIPRIPFNLIACSYLPGIPFSLGLYFFVLVPVFNKEYWVAYLIISPFIFSLFFDGIRHSAAIISSWFEEKFHCRCKFSIFWKYLPAEAMIIYRGVYNETFFSQQLDISETYYHVYEFFFNFAISTVSSFLMLIFVYDSGPWYSGWKELKILLLLAAICSFWFSQSFKRLQKNLVENYFSMKKKAMFGG